MLFYRKIKSAGCWTNEIPGKKGKITGDMISDISTKENTISLWEVKDPNDHAEILDLGIVNQLTRDSVSKQFYVLIDENELKKAGFIISNANLGKCEPLSDSYKGNIKTRHFDLINVDYDQLGILADIIQKKVKNAQFQFISDKALKKEILSLINKSIIDKSKLKDNMLHSLGLI